MSIRHWQRRTALTCSRAHELGLEFGKERSPLVGRFRLIGSGAAKSETLTSSQRVVEKQYYADDVLALQGRRDGVIGDEVLNLLHFDGRIWLTRELFGGRRRRLAAVDRLAFNRLLRC